MSIDNKNNKISKKNILVTSHRYQTGNQKWTQKERKINSSSQLYKISDFLNKVSKLSNVKIETKTADGGKNKRKDFPNMDKK